MDAQKVHTSKRKEEDRSTDSSSPGDLRGLAVEREILALRVDEIAVTQAGVASHFIGNPTKLAPLLKEIVEKDPGNDAQNQVWVTIGEESFFFERRQSSNHKIIWILPLSDKARFAKAMGWTEKVALEQLQDNEIATSGPGLAPHFVGDSSTLRNQLREVLTADPEQAELPQLTCLIGEEAFTFSKKQYGVHVVWSLPLADKARLAKAMGWRERVALEQLQDDEIPVSVSGLSRHFIGDPSNFGDQLREIIISGPEKAELPQLTCVIGEEVFTFSRRQTGTHIVWALPLSDKARLAHAMRWSEKVALEQLQDNEIATSGPGLASHFIGDSRALRNQLREVLQFNPEKAKLPQLKCTIGEEAFTFNKRQNGPSIVWALPLSDKARLAKAIGWREKVALEQLQDNEIPVSIFGLAPHFIGNPQKLRDQLREVLAADPERSTFLQLRCTIDEEVFTFRRRQTGPHIVWALLLSDKARLAQAMNWEIRKEKEPSTGVADLATFLSALGKQETASSHQNDRSSTEK